LSIVKVYQEVGNLTGYSPAINQVSLDYRRSIYFVNAPRITGSEATGGHAIAMEADLAQPETAGQLFDLAEAKLGPVDILVNNASGWLADTFTAETRDTFGRGLVRVSTKTFDRQFSVDARGSAILIAEFARRHIERQARWGRIVGLTRRSRWVSGGSVVRRGSVRDAPDPAAAARRRGPSNAAPLQ